MGHSALAAAARVFRHLPSSGRGMRDRFPSIIAATLLVVPIFVVAASLPRPALGADPKLVFTTDPTTIVAGGTSDLITIQRQDGGGAPITTGTTTVVLSSDSGTGRFRDAADSGDINTVVIPDTQDHVSFRYTDQTTPSANLTAADQAAALTSAVQPITITPAGLDHFTIGAISSPRTAGTPFTVTATAYDGYGNIKTDYTGSTASLSSTLVASPNSTAPTVPANLTWGSGTGTGSASMTAFNAEPAANQSVTVSDGGPTGTSNLFSVLPGPLASFTIGAISSPRTAGTPFTVTATAYDGYGNIKTDYTGSTASLSSTLVASPNSTAPTVPANLTWGSGTGTGSASMTAFNAEPAANQSVTVSDGGPTGTSNLFSVLPGPLASFTIGAISSPRTAGTPFTVTATAYDGYGNIKTDYTGGATVSSSTLATSPGFPPAAGTPPSYGAFGSWTNGQSSAQVTAFKAEPAVNQSVTVSDGTPSGTSNPLFSVLPGPLDHFTIGAIGSPRTAGTPFTVTATAWDTYGNKKTDYAGGATISGTLATSPGFPPAAGTPPSYGAFPVGTWSTGSKSAQVTAFRAEPLANQSVTVSDGTPSGTSNLFSVLPGPLDSFAVGAIGSPRTAGSAFTVNATAYDAYGNVKTNYGGGATVSSSTLATSPGFPPAAGTAPSYGAFGSWTNGQSSAQVTAFKAEPLANQSVTVSDGTPSGTSNPLFSVLPAPPSSIVFSDAGVSFNGQPYDTKKDTPIYSNCVPTGSGTPPCDATTSTPVKVLVRDAWGNLVTNGTSISISATTSPSGSTLGGTKTGVTAAGVATFGSPVALVVTPTGTTGGMVVTARLTGVSGAPGLPVDSRTFQLVDDLRVCTTTTCDNVAKALSYGRITAGTSGAALAASATLNGVTLTTQQVAPLAKCAGQGTQMGATTDVRVQGFGVSTLRPKFTVALIVPKTTLVNKHATARNAGSFNICLGTTWDGGGESPPPNSAVPVWKQKQLTKSGLIDAVPDTAPSPDVYWGWVPDCSPSLLNTNPCIGLRTKDASVLQSYLKLSNTDFAKLGFKSGDLGVVYLTQTPWDAKGSIF
jgi:hypothetical protein